MLGGLAFGALNTGQAIFNPLVRSLQVTNPNDFMAPPVIRMGSSDRLNINFDIIGEEHQYLRFRLLHCNADWQPSRLLESEYLDAFNDFTIEDFAYSSGTYVHFVNYNISLPDPEIPILRSGNYLLQVYPEDQRDDIILQARFSVSEEIAPVTAGVTTRTDKGVNSEYQQIFFNIGAATLRGINPYQDIIVTITQNNNPASTRTVTHPIRVDGDRIIFEHTPELIFPAGNEYRRFETVKADYPGMHVDSVKFVNGMWNAWLKQDYSRNHTNYVYDNTQHGRFMIDEYNSSDPDLSGDYVLVHFSLDPGTRQNGNIYLFGNLTNHELSPAYQLKYDIRDGLYHLQIPLKQGSYNYQYIVLPENSSIPTSATIEGNKFETRNEYLIQVFLRPPGSRGDRLISSRLTTL